MRRLLLLLLFVIPLLAQDSPLEARIAREAAALEQKLVSTRRYLHQNPELSNQEKLTAQYIVARLRELGFTDIRTGVAGHGVVALLKGGKPGPVVAWRTDMDALPIDESNYNVPYKSGNKGVKHACGHDAHMTVALGVAEVFMKLKDQLPGSIKFIFQPAEEGISTGELFGAELMIKQGVLQDPKPDAIFAFHVNPGVPAGQIGYNLGPALASVDSFDITVKGKKSHGAYPELGTDALLTAAQCVSQLQAIHSRRIQTGQPSVMSIGTIHGGDRRNIIAESIKMEGTLRTFSEATRESYRTFMKQSLQGCTQAMGADFELAWMMPLLPVTVNPPALVQRILPSLERAIGKPNVHPVEPSMAGEDFAFFQKQIPGVMLWLGVRNEAKGFINGLHTVDFDLDESALPIGVKAAATLLADYLSTAKAN
jgi:amidohydrolase